MIKIRLPSHDLWLANHPELKTAQASTSTVMKLIIVIIHHPWSYVEFLNYRLTWYPQQRSSISLVPFTGGSPPFNICCFQNPFLKFEVSSGTQRETYFQNPGGNPIEKPPKSMMREVLDMMPLRGGGLSQPCWIFFLPRLRMFRKKQETTTWRKLPSLGNNLGRGRCWMILGQFRTTLS